MDGFSLMLKGFFAGLIAMLAEMLGGADAALDLLLTFVICDIATGVLNGFLRKELNSTTMRNGLIHKVLIFVLVIVAVRVDFAVDEILGKDFHFRMLVIAFFCLEEVISLLENIANAGVPIPKWLRLSLKKVSNEMNTTTVPRFITEFFKRTLNIKMDSGSSTKISELDSETPSVDNSSEKEQGLENEKPDVSEEKQDTDKK